MNTVELALQSRNLRSRLRSCLETMRSGAVGGFTSGGFLPVTPKLKARLARFQKGKVRASDIETPRLGESTGGDVRPTRASQVTKYVRQNEPRAKGATLYVNHHGAPYWSDGVADGFHEQSVGVARVNRLTLGQYLEDFQARIEDSRRRRGAWGMEEAKSGIQFRTIGGRTVPIGIRNGQAVKPNVKPKVKTITFKRPDGTTGERKQYDPKYRKAMQEYKFSRVHANRSKIIKAISDDLVEEAKASGTTKERMAAVALLTMAHTGARPGNKSNKTGGRKTFGLTTLQVRHVKVDGDTVTLRFRGKSGEPNKYTCTDPVLAKAYKEFTARKETTDEVFRYAPHSKGVLLDQHLRDRAQEISPDLKPKDLRTAMGTDVATRHILDVMNKKIRVPESAKEQTKLFKKIMKKVCTKVSRQLNNTPAVCKSAYIDPLLWGRMAVEMGFTKVDKKVLEGSIKKSTTPDEFIRRAMYNTDLKALRTLLGDEAVDAMVDAYIESEASDDDFFADDDAVVAE